MGATVVVVDVVVATVVVGAASALLHPAAARTSAQSQAEVEEGRTGSEHSDLRGLSCGRVMVPDYPAPEWGKSQTDKEKCVRVVIAGCGRVGSDLALSLADAGHDVSVLDIDSDAFRQLGSAFDGTTHRGSAFDIRVLREAGIEFADAFAAATRDDNVNLMAVQVATQVFGVPKTVARLDDPRRTDAYRALRVRHVAAGELTSLAIQQQLLEDQSQYHVSSLGRGIDMVEMVMSADADGATVADLEIEGRLRVAAIRRGMETHIGRPDFVLEEDDLVVAAAEDGIGSKVRRYCKVGEE